MILVAWKQSNSSFNVTVYRKDMICDMMSRTCKFYLIPRIMILVAWKQSNSSFNVTVYYVIRCPEPVSFI